MENEEKRTGFVFLPSYYDAIRPMDDDMRLRLYDAILDYGIEGVTPTLEGIEQSMFALVKATLIAVSPGIKHALPMARRAVDLGRKEPGENQRKKPKKKTLIWIKRGIRIWGMISLSFSCQRKERRNHSPCIKT